MDKYKGFLFAILSSSAFGIMPIFSKIAYSNGSNPTTVLIFRFSIATIILFLYLLNKKINIYIELKSIIMLILTGFIGYTLTTQTLFASYNYLDGGLATTLHFIYPAIVCILGYIVFKDKMSIKKTSSLIIAGIGVYTLIALEHHELNTIGVSLALFSGVSYAVNVLILGTKRVKNIDNKVSTMYVCFGAFLGMLLFGFCTNSISTELNTTLILCYLGISTISTIGSMILLMKSIKLIGTSSASILGTFEPIISILLGVLLLNENLSISLIIGTILILASTIILTLDNKYKNDDTDSPPIKEAQIA